MAIMSATVRYALHTTTLGNGLRVIVNPDPSVPVVALNIWYDVGSRDEQPGRTGLAHLFEHLMFEGSANVTSGEHLATVQSVGGSANAIAPGGTETGLTASYQMPPDVDFDLVMRYSGFRGMGTADDIARLFAFVASDDGSNIHGAVLSSDRGITAG